MADQDYKDLIDTLIAEVGGEPRASQIAAAYAIANRAAQKGKTPAQIVREPKQFTGYANPGSAAKRAQKDPKVRARLEAVWRDVETRAVPDPLKGGTMFHTKSSSPYWASAENKYGTKNIGGHTYYLGSGAKASPSTALAAIDAVAPAPTSNLPSLRSAYAATLPELPRARPVTPAPRRVTTDDIIRNSTTPQNVDQTLQAALNARYAQKPVASASDLARGKTPSKFAEMPVGLPQVLPGVSSWDGFYGSLGIPKAAPKVAAKAGPSASDMARGKTPAAAKPTRVAGVDDVGYPYSFKAVDAILNPRPTTSLSGPKPTIATFQPIAPTPPAGPGYNSVTAAQRNALSALPTPPRLSPSVLPETPLTTGGIAPQRVAQIGVPVGNAVDPLGKRVTVPVSASVPLPRVRPAAPAIPASLAQPAQIAAPPTNLGPVKNFLGMPNAVPKSFAVAPNAPLPAPRLDRPGIFGNPNIGGISIPLPGVLGVIQNATKAMNNASGPFNNGLDNALYQGLRGGNFTAPGAATHIGTDGFLFKQNPNGSFTNVGRAPAGTPTGAKGPSTYSTATERIYERGSLGRSGAEASSIYG